jgi:hypothetical protein
MGLWSTQGDEDGFCLATALHGSVPLPFVIPSEVEGSAVQPTFTGNVFRQSEAQRRDLRFLCSTSEVAFLLTAKILYDPKREPQIPRLRLAPIGLTNRTLLREL